jgi:Na+/H+ antiporter NhaA
MCWLAVVTRICTLPHSVRWTHIAGAGLLGGIGFTMSIFIHQPCVRERAGDDRVVETGGAGGVRSSQVAGAGLAE